MHIVHVHVVLLGLLIYCYNCLGYSSNGMLKISTLLLCFLQDEAFDLWQQRWGKLYPDDSTSRLVIDDICNNYYLVNLVDNDFIKGNCLWEALERTVHLREVRQNNRAVLMET